MDLREKIARKHCEIDGENWEATSYSYFEDAKKFIEIFQDWLKEEVGEMENPYHAVSPLREADKPRSVDLQWAGFEQCRESLLDKIEKEVIQ